MDLTDREKIKQPNSGRPARPCRQGQNPTLLVLATMLLVTAPVTQAFLDARIYQEPTTVQYKGANLGFWGIPEQRIPAGGYIKLTAPDEIYTYVAGISCYDVIKNTECTVTSFRNTFTVTVDYEISAGTQFEFQISQAINNPISEKPSDFFQLLTSVGELETGSEYLSVIATRGRMNKYILSPESEVVGQSTTLKVEFSGQHDFPRGAYIFIDFPKWNPENPVIASQKPYIQGNEACEPVKILDEDLFCDFSNDRLIVQKASTVNIVANTDLSFSVTGFKNPIQASYVAGFRIQTAILFDAQFYVIDEDETQLTVSQYATLSSARFSVINPDEPTAGMIQEINDMRLDFYLPVPLNGGCQLEIILPEQYSVDDIQSLTTQQAFGAFQVYTEAKGNLRVNPTTRSLKLEGVCPGYVENDKVATIEFFSLRQPNYEKPTNSVRVYITSQNDDQIAMVDQKVTFTPESGTIIASTDATVYEVQEPTKVLFEIVPEHAIYMADEPEILVEFPPELKIQTTQCQIEAVSMDGSDATIAEQCFRNQQTFRVKTFLGEDYIPAAEGEEPKKIRFTLGQVTNPVSVQPVDGIQIVIYAFGLYSIDEFEGGIDWMPVKGDFVSARAVPTSPVAYDPEVTYTIYFTPEHLIPQNGYIEIDFPKEISVPDFSYSQSSCRGLTDSAFSTNQISCNFLDEARLSDPFRLRDPNTPTHFTMRIQNAFRRTSVAGRQEYALEIPGLRNPIQTVPTHTFQFRTYDQLDRLIDSLNEGVTVRMTEPSILDIVLVSLGSYTNSRRTAYTVTMVPTVPVWEQNLILITFPPQVSLPDSSVSLGCTTVFASLLADVKCSYLADAADAPIGAPYDTRQTVRVELTFAAGVQQIDPLDRFSITMQNMRNPSTTETTDSVQVRITDQNYLENNSKLTGTLITMNNAHQIAKATARASSPAPGIEAAYELEFYPEHAIAPGGGILAVYPPQALLGEAETLTAEVTIDGLAIDQSLLNISFDLSARAVTVRNIVQGQSPFVPIVRANGGSKISVKLIGLLTPFTSDPTDSFQMTTFNLVGDNFYYFIDEVVSGLQINSKCNYPCKDCLSSSPSTCLACYPDHGRPFLQVNTCVEECATDRYYDAGTDRCELCDSTCLTCDTTAQTCTSCGVGDHLFLHRSSCLTICPDGFIEDPTANLCKPCLANCLTCEGLATSCTSCDTRSFYKYFFHESCIDGCIPDISVQVDDECVECDSTCKTCAGTPQTCTSCESHMKLDPFRQRCEDRCEAEVQVFNEETLECEFCADSCTKCAGSTQTCTACKEGYVLNFDQTCQETCGASNQTPIDGICQACEEPCFECSGSVSTCDSCISDYFLYLGTKCVQYCPEKYEEVEGTCIYEGLVCPAGFQLNKSKDGCIPLTFDCQPGYTINEQETACIPEPGSAVPFPFLLCALLLCLLVLGSYLKDKPATKVYSNLIGTIGALELIMYVMMSSYAYALSEYLILMFAAIGLGGLIASNILFASYYHSQITVKDQVFVKWLHFFPKTKTWLPLLALILNFKMSRFLYSGFYGLESTMGKFGRQKQFFYLLRLSAYFSFVFCYGFIFIADAIILLSLDWGYQLGVLAIETIVLQVIMIILMMLEFRQGSAKLLSSAQSSDQFALIKPNGKGGKQFRVMGAIEDGEMDNDDYQEGIPDMDEDTLIRSKIKTEQLEINLRQQALARILNQVGGHPTEKGVDLNDCMTKFDPERIRIRRAFSMSDLHSEGSWVAEGSDAGDDNPEQPLDGKLLGLEEGEEPRQRRYSFPLSPRRHNNLPNTGLFERQIEDIKTANKDFLIDNVYTETKPILDPFAKRKVKTISRRTQTYLRELLQVAGEEVHESDMEVLMEEEAEIDFDFAKGLIKNVIDQISSADESQPAQEKKKKPKKKVFKPKKEIPDFELADIMGDFEIDDMGNFIIMRGDGGELLDQRERLVNRRGYLIDRFGNVINNQGNIIFKAIELDIDDEIPAPFGFEKRKKNLLKLGDENHFRVESVQGTTPKGGASKGQSEMQLEDEKLLDDQVTAIKNESLLMQRERSQDESPKDESPRQPRQDEAQDAQMNSAINQQSVLEVSREQDAATDEDDKDLEAEIDQLVKRKVPKKRRTLKGGKVKKLDNLPPKRIRPEDVPGLFPHLGIEHDEQKRLAKIASSISGLANQLADKQRQQQLVEDRKRSATVQATPFDWNQLQDDQKLDHVRQEHLNDIMNQQRGPASDLAMTEQYRGVGAVDQDYDKSFMMQDRPVSNTTSLNMGGVPIARQMSVITRPQRATEPNLARNKTHNKPLYHQQPNPMRDRTDEMKKVYGQTFDMSGYDENELLAQQYNTGLQSQAEQQSVNRRRRGQSGRPEGRMAGLETIYMTKIPKVKPQIASSGQPPSGQKKQRHFSAQRPLEHNPFRPTLNRFADDPSELNVNTTMQGSQNVGGRDILEIADKLDQMQRDYMTHNRGGMATQKLSHAPPMLSSQSRRLLDDSLQNLEATEQIVSGNQSHFVQQPNYPGLQGTPKGPVEGGRRYALNSEAGNSLDAVRQGNWVGRE